VCFYQIQTGGILQHELDTGIFESRSDYEQKKYDRKVFDAVIGIYSDLRERHPLAAFCYDEFNRSSKKLTPIGIEYLCDIETTSRFALKNPALYRLWERVVEGDETVPLASFAQLVSKCSPWYQKRGLLPHDYFRHIKQGQKDRRTVPAANTNQVAA
jgi:hypothetical protein